MCLFCSKNRGYKAFLFSHAFHHTSHLTRPLVQSIIIDKKVCLSCKQIFSVFRINIFVNSTDAYNTLVLSLTKILKGFFTCLISTLFSSILKKLTIPLNIHQNVLTFYGVF